MKFAIISALAAVSLAGSAFAETTVTATLDSTQATPVKFIASEAVWDCSGTTCVAASAPDDSTGLSGCEGLVKKIGRVASYTSDERTLDARSLERCNQSAPAPTTTASR